MERNSVKEMVRKWKHLEWWRKDSTEVK